MPSLTVLVTGGAGYIGSHAALALLAAGHRVVVLDDLTTGRRELVPAEAEFVAGDAGDPALVDPVLATRRFDAVMHFAGSIIVEDSVKDPLAYHRNNVSGSRNLIESCVRAGVGRFIFSSSAAVYGVPATLPVPESAPLLPINPYGGSKVMTEWMLRDVEQAHGMRHVALRYFNVAGADARLRSGESVPKATHLVKLACLHAIGLRDQVSVFGADYPTPDGTCVRDYVHVADVASAHVAALDHLMAGGASGAFNVGYGRGQSVREVLDCANRICGGRLVIRDAARRPGDPPSLVADARRIASELGWRPQHEDLELIVRSALAWERHLHGRAAA